MPPSSMPGSYFDRSPEDLSTQYSSSRKRPRLDCHDRFTSRISDDTRLGASVSSIDIASPSPLANTDYFLSGGLDTPGGWQNQCYETREAIEHEDDHRPNRFMQRQPPNSTLSPPATPSPYPIQTLDGQSSTAHSISGWHLRQMAWAVTGGLAGKIFNFCWNTTFSGFAAGGGQAYAANHPDTSTHDTPHALSSRRPLAPNRDTPSQDSVTRGSWVFVSQSVEAEEPESPVRKRPRASIAGAAQSGTTRPSLAGRVRTDSASFASPRSRTNSFSRTHVRTNSSSHGFPHKSPSSPAARNKRTRPSLASPHRRQSSYFGVSSTHASPVSPEIEQYRRQKKREEKRQDESFRKLNSQLQDMIREGQAALGSKVEVDHDHDTDEGYFEDFHD